MKTATLIMEGSRKQAEFVHYALTKLLSFVRWQDTIFFEITEEQNKCLSKDYMTLRETWWPVARSLLKKEGEADIESFQQLISSANLLSQRITKILGRNLINKITTPVDFYFICSSLPFEWLLCDGVPLSLYAPFYRFVKPQHILSRFAPIDDGKKSFIAPKYSDPSLSGINDAVKESTYWVINDPSVALLENNVSKSIIHQYEDRQFSRLLFHGHSKKEGMLASNGEIIPFNEILRLVQGPAFILGCSTGAFDSGQIHKMGSQIPLGLHGALLCSFPIPGEFSKLINEIIVSTFRKGDARRVQDIAHMTRLALSYMGIIYALRSLSGIPFRRDKQLIMVTPFEGDYDGLCNAWGTGVEVLKEQTGSMNRELQDYILAVAGLFSIGVTCCGTPAFLLPDASNEMKQALMAFITWNGSV